MEIITNSKLFEFEKQKFVKMPSSTNLATSTTTSPTTTTAATINSSTSEQFKRFLNNVNKNLNSSLNSLTSTLKTTKKRDSSSSVSPRQQNKPSEELVDDLDNSSNNNNINDCDTVDDTSVRVALRIRPQLARERIDMCKVCTYVTPNEPQVTLGHDKSFTFDYVFDVMSKQEIIFNECVKSLIDGCLNGYNATVLAYGQTGSGKTFTMGTSFDMNLLPEDDGIIPRAVGYLFKKINEKIQNCNESSSKPSFEVVAQFMELYNEDIVDLFDPNKTSNMIVVNAAAAAASSASSTMSSKTNGSNKIEIHEDHNGNVFVNGCTMRTVSSATDVCKYHDFMFKIVLFLIIIDS